MCVEITSFYAVDGVQRSPGTFILPFIAEPARKVKCLIFIFHRSRLSVISVYYEALAGDSVEILAPDESSGALLGYLRHFGVLGK